MQKFTIFSVILALVVMLVAGEMVVKEYFPNLIGQSEAEQGSEFVFNLPQSLDLDDSMQTDVLGSGVLNNRLGADLSMSEQDVPDIFEHEELDLGYVEFPVVPNENQAVPRPVVVDDFEDSGSYGSYLSNVYLREDQILSAGFVNAFFEEEAHDGKLYKTIVISDLFDLEMTKYAIKNENSLLAKIYVLLPGPKSPVSEVYEVLKVRASNGLEIELNETNSFGDASFYMNDSLRQSTAFLTVRFGQVIYGFSYPKEYHSQISNLVKLLDMEF